jgi:hypothetical protein
VRALYRLRFSSSTARTVVAVPSMIGLRTAKPRSKHRGDGERVVDGAAQRRPVVVAIDPDREGDASTLRGRGWECGAAASRTRAGDVIIAVGERARCVLIGSSRHADRGAGPARAIVSSLVSRLGSSRAGDPSRREECAEWTSRVRRRSKPFGASGSGTKLPHHETFSARTKAGTARGCRVVYRTVTTLSAVRAHRHGSIYGSY